jgi:hypothetical protein
VKLLADYSIIPDLKLCYRPISNIVLPVLLLYGHRSHQTDSFDINPAKLNAVLVGCEALLGICQFLSYYLLYTSHHGRKQIRPYRWPPPFDRRSLSETSSSPPTFLSPFLLYELLRVNLLLRGKGMLLDFLLHWVDLPLPHRGDGRRSCFFSYDTIPSCWGSLEVMKSLVHNCNLKR